jgi:hypothetical protein
METDPVSMFFRILDDGEVQKLSNAHQNILESSE